MKLGLTQDKFCFNLENEYNPEEIVRMILPEINEATKGFVKGDILPYTGTIFSYKTLSAVAVLASNLQAEKEVNVQEKLGEIQPKENKYEVFLTARDIEDYKYRIMFLRFGVGGYPVTSVVSEDLAFEYTNGRTTYIFESHSMQEFEKLIQGIFTTKKLKAIIQGVIDASVRGDYRNNISENTQE